MSDDTDTELPPKPRLKRPLSMKPAAIRKRRSRELQRQMEKAGATLVSLLITEQYIDKFEAGGHLDTRLERFDPKAAYREALVEMLEAYRPANKMRF